MEGTESDSDLYQDLDSKSIKSGWSQRRNIIQSRKKGWMGRLKSDIMTGKVEALNSARNNEKCSVDFTMFPPIHVDLKRPVLPVMEKVSNLAVDSLSQSVLCMVCFSYVSIGSERVVCQHCPVVIHFSCIENPMDYHMSGEGKNVFSQIGKNYHNIPTSYDIKWTCAFCIHDVNKKNHDAVTKYHKDMVSHVFKSAIVKVQSYFRMYPQKVGFQRKIVSVKILQRLYRHRHFRVAVVIERLLERRAVRLRVHEVIAYLEDPESTLRGSKSDEYQIDLDEKYFFKVDTNLFNTTNMVPAELPVGVNSLTMSTIESIEAKEKTSRIRKSVLTNMLIASGGGCDPAATLNDVDRGPFPPKSFFLTITVNKIDDMKQLYRVDIPLREADEVMCNEVTAEQMKIIDRVGTLLEGNPVVYEHVTRVKLYPPKPYVLLPACPGGVVITMTLSRVTEWPRASYICDHSYAADHAMVWRQVSCMSQGMTPREVPVIPSSMRRLQMFVSKGHNLKAAVHARQKQQQALCLNKVIRQMNLASKNSIENGYESDGDSVVSSTSMDSVTSLASISSLSSASSPTKFPRLNEKHLPSPSRSHYKNKIVSAARILWTIIPTPNAGVVVGYMHFHSQMHITSSFVKFWCVVIDNCLVVFKNRSDTKPPRESINLTRCHFSLCDGEMIRIFQPSDKKVWYCKGSTANKRHDWVAWIQAACSTPPPPTDKITLSR